jgi:WD40 repeat protein
VRNPANGLQTTIARYNPHSSSSLLAVGCNTGSVVLFNLKEKSQKVLQSADRTVRVVDLQWDPLSSIYLLVAYANCVVLWDSESASVLVSFEHQALNISGVAWMDWTAGNFITTNSKTSVVKVWNASQKAPIQAFKIRAVNDSGIVACCFSAGNKRLLSLCADGSVCIYNMLREQLEYCSSAGHTDTIFCCSFSPISPNIFATCSYDGTVKLWNLADLTLKITLHGGGELLYWLDWSPKGTVVAAVNGIGHLILWDAETGRELARYSHHSKPCYSVSWNKVHENMLATTSADHNLVVIFINYENLYDPNSSTVVIGSRRKGAAVSQAQQAKSDIRFQFAHGAPVYGCAWHPKYASVIATGCQDGLVRVFNHMLAFPLVHILHGHTARVFNVFWSILNPGLLASGSDDTNICIWELDLSKIDIQELKDGNSKALVVSAKNTLTGHKSFVRALSWSSEHRR